MRCRRARGARAASIRLAALCASTILGGRSAAAATQVPVTSQVTVGVKHTSTFPRRRQMLALLVQSIRDRYGLPLRVLVADDGGRPDTEMLASFSAELISLPSRAGLSYGRNALVQATRTPFVAIMDDDVLFDASTSLEALYEALHTHPGAALAAGCYRDVRFGGHVDCFALHFEPDESGAVVRARAVESEPGWSGCRPVHAAHNFFVARTATVTRFGWDPRQRVMEHETFFYQLFLNEQPVLSCPGVSVRHNTTRDNEYRERSFRLQERRFMQYLCKNFAELARFYTPHMQWRCDTRTYCAPAWSAQFVYDGSQCKPMLWDHGDDESMVRRPLVSPRVHGGSRFPPANPLVVANAQSEPRHVALLALIFTEEGNVARRAWQRATWLSFAWHRGYLDRELVPWRHVYVRARRAQPRRGSTRRDKVARYAHPATAKSSGEGGAELDELVGDTVTLRQATEGYDNLVFKTLEALRWAVKHVSFDVLLKTDDDSMVHVGRLWTWLHIDRLKVEPRPPEVSRLYAGRIFHRSQVIRRNFTRADLWHPEWYPRSFLKWAVDPEVYAGEAYPPYCGGGGYLVGREVARRLTAGYDAWRGHTVRIEDAFVGILAHEAGIRPTEIDTFQEPAHRSHQTRENFIDQSLVHRVAEPEKAFRWLMLSSNCHSGPWECARQRNRTRGLAVTGDEAPEQPFGDVSHWERDWVSGPIPRAARDASTGGGARALPGVQRPAAGAGGARSRGGTRRRGRGKRGMDRGKRKDRGEKQRSRASRAKRKKIALSE